MFLMQPVLLGAYGLELTYFYYGHKCTLAGKRLFKKISFFLHYLLIVNIGIQFPWLKRIIFILSRNTFNAEIKSI